MVNQSLFRAKRSSTPNTRIMQNLESHMERGSQKDISNQSSLTPNRTENLNSGIMLNQLNDLDTGSDRYGKSNFIYTKQNINFN